ncbi:MAG: glycosyltransferase [Candidatus Daviesbacteria bacterium]|nr:glycosyltransferase [Candidatus Daviesbacteria bacterium]
MGSKKIYIFALAAAGQGISGGDRIFIEFARRWSKEFPVTIFLWEEGFQMCQRQGLQISNIKYQISNMDLWKRLGFIINYLARIFEGIRLGLTTKLENTEDTIVYSASEFWMDSLPCFLLKLRFSKIKWVAAWYQTAPSPLKGFSGSLIYWLVQLPIKPLIDRFADFVLVNNALEKKVFKRLDRKNKAIVVLGAVNIQEIDKWKKKLKDLPKVYDGVFQGRFHPQKGVMELIDIWKIVVDKKPDVKLVMIGDGPLMKNLKFKISNLKLEKNIILTGYLFDGEEKYKIFAQSKVVVHPAIFDSGGMASAEAMAFGLPCVGFNLKSYKYYYPSGMEKVKEGDLEAFADKVLELLQDNNLYKRVANEALHLISDKWSWEYRARQILNAVLE